MGKVTITPHPRPYCQEYKNNPTLSLELYGLLQEWVSISLEEGRLADKLIQTGERALEPAEADKSKKRLAEISERKIEIPARMDEIHGERMAKEGKNLRGRPLATTPSIVAEYSDTSETVAESPQRVGISSFWSILKKVGLLVGIGVGIIGIYNHLNPKGGAGLAVGSMQLAGGSPIIHGKKVNLLIDANSATKFFKVSEDPEFAGLNWQTVSKETTFEFSGGGAKVIWYVFGNADGVENGKNKSPVKVFFPPKISNLGVGFYVDGRPRASASSQFYAPVGSCKAAEYFFGVDVVLDGFRKGPAEYYSLTAPEAPFLEYKYVFDDSESVSDKKWLPAVKRVVKGSNYPYHFIFPVKDLPSEIGRVISVAFQLKSEAGESNLIIENLKVIRPIYAQCN